MSASGFFEIFFLNFF